MKLRHLALPVALAASLLITGRARADILAVENGTNSVLRFNGTGQQFTFTAPPNNNLDYPFGIGLDASNNVYVVNQYTTDPTTETNANSVAKFSPTGTPLGLFVSKTTPTPPPGGPPLNSPVDIAFDSNGNAYVTSGAAGTPGVTGYFAKFDPAGNFVNSYGAANTNVPSGIGYNPTNNLLYIVNSATTGTNANSILIYNPANIAAAPMIITPTGAGALDNPEQIAFDKTGNVYIANFGVAGNATVQEYNSSGAYIRTIASVAGGGAEGVAIDPNTNILYASYFNTGTIEKYQLGATVMDLGPLATGLDGVLFLAFTPVPEPASLALTGIGLAVIGGYGTYRRRRAA